MRDYVTRTLERFGRIDGLYNNAGIEGEQNPIADYTSEGFDRVVSINLNGVFFGMKYALPHFQAQGSGSIVNAASVGGIRAVPNLVGIRGDQARRGGHDQAGRDRIRAARRPDQRDRAPGRS